MGKYESLAKYLRALTNSEVSLSFDEIERIIRFRLPRSARRYRSWWSNDRTHYQALDGWLSVDWKVDSAEMEGGIVTFRRALGIREEGRRQKLYVARKFEELARSVMSQFFRRTLMPGKRVGWPRRFDMVSPDYKYVGEAKFLSKSRRGYIATAKFSAIAEDVWLLEKIDAKKKFIVFGNDEQVPRMWLKRYGHLAKGVRFYFMDRDGRITLLT